MRHSATGWTEAVLKQLTMAAAIALITTTLARAQTQPQAQPLPPPPSPPPQQQPQPAPQPSAAGAAAGNARTAAAAGARPGIRAADAPAAGHAAAAAARARGVFALDQDAGAYFDGRGCDPDRRSPRLRHRVEHVVAGDRVRGRRRARPDTHKPSRRHAGPGEGLRDIPQSRRGRARAGVSRSRSRLRLLSLRPEEAPLHPARRVAAVPRRRADRRRDPCRGQRRGRAALDPRGNARAARSPGA